MLPEPIEFYTGMPVVPAMSAGHHNELLFFQSFSRSGGGGGGGRGADPTTHFLCDFLTGVQPSTNYFVIF